MTPTPQSVLAVVDREFWTAVRNRTLAGLAAGFLAVVVAVAVAGTGGRGGFVPLALDLTTAVEVLVPLLAFAFAYRSITGDVARGELDVLRTFPLTRTEYVLGVFLGRAAALLPVVVVAVGLAGVAPALSGPDLSVIATHGAADSPLLYLRFLTLSGLFSLAVLAVAVAASAAARSVREALALAVLAAVALVVGADAAVVASVAGGLFGGLDLAFASALSPNGAFRGLVLETVVGPVSDGGPRAAYPLASLVGLLAWLAGGLAVAVRVVWT